MPISYDIPGTTSGTPEGATFPVLNDGEFELDGFRFGGENDSVVIQPGGFDPGVADWRTQDQDSAAGDGTLFGRDFLVGPTWGFTFLTNKYSVGDALDSLEAMAALWQGNANRSIPGAVSVLRYNIGGRTRRAYGRPRRWGLAVTPDLWGGVAPVIADFKRVDAMHYDDVLVTTQIGLISIPVGGLEAPLMAPLSTVGVSQRAAVADSVGGNAPAPFIVTLHGPITNPWIAGPGWRFDFLTTLAYDQTLTIDTRPWAKTALRNDGASLAGALTRTSTPLSVARLLPGAAEFTFGGNDGTGTATCMVSWRPTYHSL